MSRIGDFLIKSKRSAINRQNGVCAFCGVSLNTPFTKGNYQGYAHHLQPIRHGGKDNINNCVYLCWGHHQLLGHGMSPYGIDNQGGSSNTWVRLNSIDFMYWHNNKK